MLKWIIILIVPVIVYSQIDKRSYYSYGERLYAESFIQASSSPDSSEIIVFFRIMNDALVFTTDEKGIFISTPEIEVSFTGSEGIIRKRLRWLDTVYVSRFEETSSKTNFVYGAVSGTLANDLYEARVQLIQNGTGESRSKELAIKADGKLESAFFMDMISFRNVIGKRGEFYFPYIMNGKLPFQSNDTYMVISSNISDEEGVKYEINKEKTDIPGDWEWDSEIKLNGNVEILENTRMYVFNNNGGFEVKKSKSMHNTTLIVNIPGAELVPGKYKLKLFRNADYIEKEFNVHWNDQPLSLRDVKYAIESMYYILTDDEYDLMRDGSRKEQFDKMIEFWKKKDPTPSTPFNEAMAEYFKRVDYAFFNYQSIVEKDGSKTDRGKIYILFGMPDNIESGKKNGNPIEIWEYPEHGKKFTFEAVSGGVYMLIEVDES